MLQYDAIIIGGGVVGSAIARELSRFRLRIAVLEKNLDVCLETSGRNSAVVHGGFAYDNFTNKAALCVEGCHEFETVAKQLQVPFRRTGKVLVGNTDEDYKSLERTIENGKRNGAKGLTMIGKDRLRELVPAVKGEFAMLSEWSGILDPFQYTIALAENAACNGVCYHFDREVTSITREGARYRITAGGEVFETRFVVNSAGLQCSKISEMLGIPGYRILGSKGDYLILDRRVGPLLPMPVYPVPSNTYMGIHVTPTVDGNVIVGPNAEYVEDFQYYGVPQRNMDYLAEDASKLWPQIRKADYIRCYSGILPKWVTADKVIHDFVIEAREETPGVVNLVGIESPGLTAALPIARRVVSLIQKQETLLPNESFCPERKGIVRFADQTKEEQCRLIAENPDYGEIICRCGQITKAEILKALDNPLGVDTLTGVKYRTRAMMGRCQGGYCQTRLTEMIKNARGKKDSELLYARKGSYLFTGEVRP